MRTIDFILDTLAHFVTGRAGPPPGVPAHVHPKFEHELTWLCDWHAVTPIIVRSLDALALSPRLSRITSERIRAVARADANLARDLARTAVELDEALRARDVEPMWLQGVVLARRAYPDPSLRPLHQLRVLLREKDWGKAVDACREIGFRETSPWPPGKSGREALEFHQYFAPCRLRTGEGDRLALQFRVFDVGPPEAEEIAWQRAQPCPIANRTVASGSLEDHLIIGSLVFATSRVRRLLHAVDIGLLLRRFGPELDWGYIERRLRSRSAYSAVALTIDRVIRMFALPARRMGLDEPGVVRRRIYATLWTPYRLDDTKHRWPHLRRIAYHLLETSSVREKLLFVWRLLSPPRDWVTAFFGRPYRPWQRIRFFVRVMRGGSWVQ